MWQTRTASLPPSSLSEITRAIEEKESSNHPWTTEKDWRSSILGFFLEITDKAGVIHKACDSLDHMEGISGDAITVVIVQLFVVLLLAGKKFGVNYEEAVPARWREIEQTKVL